MKEKLETKKETYIDPKSLAAGVGSDRGRSYGWTENGERYFWVMDADDLIKNRAKQFPFPCTQEQIDLNSLERVYEAGVAVTTMELRRYMEAVENSFDWFIKKNDCEDLFLLGPSVRNVKGHIRYNHTRRGVWQRTG